MLSNPDLGVWAVALPLLLGKVFPCDLGGFLPDVGGSVGVLQLVHVHVEGHGVCGGEVFAETGDGG